MPINPPPLVSVLGTGYQNKSATGMNIPWGVMNCQEDCFVDEHPGSSICYGVVATGNREVEAPWTIAERDVEDAIWYSTCYVRALLLRLSLLSCTTNFGAPRASFFVLFTGFGTDKDQPHGYVP